MSVGDILVKLGQGNVLSHAELEELRMKMNSMEFNSSSVSTWLKGSSSPSFENVTVKSSSFEVPPFNGSFFGSNWGASASNQTIPSGTGGSGPGGYTPLDTNTFISETVYPDSFIVWYDKTASEFHVNPSFASKNARSFMLMGNYITGSAPQDVDYFIQFYNKSDDSTATNGAATLQNAVDNLIGSFSKVIAMQDFTDNPGGLYFKLFARHATGGDVDFRSFFTFFRIF